MTDLCCRRNKILVFLNFACDTHIHIFITDRDDKSSNEGWIDLGCEFDVLICLDELLLKNKFY